MAAVFNFLKIIQQLENEPPEAVDLAWIEESYRNPPKFWQDFDNYYSSQFSPLPKSRPFESYDFYYDIVIRNLQSDRIALRWYEEERGWQSLSFMQLHAQVCEEVQKWLLKGVVPGQSLCMILPLGVRYVVVLLACLRMGLTVSYLPPQGDQFLAKRLKLLAPDFLVTDYIYVPLLGPFEKLLLDKKKDDAKEIPDISSVYPTGTAVGKFFSPLSKNSHIPRPLSSDDMYLSAIRDSTLVFSLKSGDHLAAPGFHPWQYQPTLLLTTLLAGATYVHLTLENITQHPELLGQFPLKALGINTELRDILLGKKKINFSCTSWFRDVAEPLNWAKWDLFLKNFEMKDLPGRNIFYHAAGGGCLMFSLLRKGNAGIEVLPIPGKKWQLVDLNLSGKESHTNFGIWGGEDQETDKTPLGAIVLCRKNKEWAFIGTREPRRSGRSMPTEEILDCLRALPFIVHVSLFGVTSGEEAQQAKYILLVFVGFCEETELAEKKKVWHEQIRMAIYLHLGGEFMPDRIEFYPLYAREKEGVLLHDWCQFQYITGNLHNKSEHQIYQALTKLRSLATEPTT